MRFCSLGSGSHGNAHIVEHRNTTLLIDCGFSLRELTRRLATRHITPAEIDAIIVSHEHNDHVAGLKILATKHAIPFYLSAGTAHALASIFSAPLQPAAFLRANDITAIRDLSVYSLPVPHDATEVLQFVIEDGARRLAIFTDLGHITPAVIRICGDVDMLVLECNYDDQLLRNNKKYPPRVIERVAGNYGHLSNAASARLVSETITPRRRNIIAAHLSAENNTSELAHAALSGADNTATITIATQEDGTDWLTV